MFRGLMFESEASEFQEAGIQVGADRSRAEEQVLSEQLAPFSLLRRNQALEMARLYAVMHCFENAVRELIKDTLSEQLGADWWKSIPSRVSRNAESRQKKALKDSWLQGEKELLGFLDFGDLAKIIIENWQHFEDLVPSQQWLTQRMEEIEAARHFIAHNRILLPSEFQRLYMYVDDWDRQIGL